MQNTQVKAITALSPEELQESINEFCASDVHVLDIQFIQPLVPELHTAYIIYETAG